MSREKSFLFNIKKEDQYVAINDLVLEIRDDVNYYSLLILSSIIIASGVLLSNSAILIGGMLITPVLTPILLLSLAIITSRPILIKKTSKLLFKSFFIVFVVSFLSGLVFANPENKDFFSTAIINNSIYSAFLYFIVAFVSGVAATFAWVRKRISNIFPAISIAVSLVPPISLFAILISMNDLDLAKFFFLVFLFNMIGIIIGSMIVFSILKFYRIENKIEEIVNGYDKDKK